MTYARYSMSPDQVCRRALTPRHLQHCTYADAREAWRGCLSFMHGNDGWIDIHDPDMFSRMSGSRYYKLRWVDYSPGTEYADYNDGLVYVLQHYLVRKHHASCVVCGELFREPSWLYLCPKCYRSYAAYARKASHDDVFTEWLGRRLRYLASDIARKAK